MMDPKLPTNEDIDDTDELGIVDLDDNEDEDEDENQEADVTQ
jgi:hypothetical protein